MLYRANENPYKSVEWLPTGFASLDRILGGGIPSRKITEISGLYSVGKSTLALIIVAQAQKRGMPCLWVDSEFSFGEDYATLLGVDTGQLDLIIERYAELALDGIEAWADATTSGLIVLDSIGHLLPRQEAEKSAEGKTIGLQAKLIATFCRKMIPILAINNISLVVLNHQVTDLMTGRIKTSGGAKLEYSKAIWLSMRKGNRRILKGENQIGEGIICEIRKNKLAPTNKQSCDLTLLFGEGFSAEADLLQELIEKGEVTKVGNTYFRGETKLGTGLTKAREALKK